MKHVVAFVMNRLFPAPPPTEQELLLDSLHTALHKYTRAMEKFTAQMKDLPSVYCGYAQMLLEEIEDARYEYHQLRIVYEKNYGNIRDYRRKLTLFEKWINNPSWNQEDKPKCLFNTPLPTDTKALPSERAPITTGIV